MMSRLLAYHYAVSFLIRANAYWPTLFHNFDVVTIPSSIPSTKFNVRNKSLTAASIVGRLTRKEKDIEAFRSFVAGLQSFNLDDRIAQQFTSDKFRPVVHSETLMLNHIEFTGGISSARFFNGWMYIGCSKPLCRLCKYYYLEHGSVVGHRGSHGNLYLNWRFPDVLEAQGECALRRRADMLERLLRKVRNDAFDLVRKRVTPTYRSHDSMTTSARISLEDRWSGQCGTDDVASILSQLCLGTDDDDDGEGGVKL